MGRGQQIKELSSAQAFTELLGSERGSERPWDAIVYGRPTNNAKTQEQLLAKEIAANKPENVLHLLQTQNKYKNPRLERLQNLLISHCQNRTASRWETTLISITSVAGQPQLSPDGMKALKSQLGEMLSMQIIDNQPHNQEELDSYCDTEVVLGLPIALAFTMQEGGPEAIEKLLPKVPITALAAQKQTAQEFHQVMDLYNWVQTFEEDYSYLLTKLDDEKVREATRKILQQNAIKQFKLAKGRVKKLVTQ